MKASVRFYTHDRYRLTRFSLADLYEALRDTLFQDSSVAGEASGYAMGLVMLGSGSQTALDEMIQYAHETQHEKIIRGLAIGIAFLMYGRAEQADSVIDQLLADKVSLTCELEASDSHRLFIGRYPSVRWHVHHRSCLRGDRQQPSDKKAFAGRGFGCQ